MNTVTCATTPEVDKLKREVAYHRCSGIAMAARWMGYLIDYIDCDHATERYHAQILMEGDSFKTNCESAVRRAYGDPGYADVLASIIMLQAGELAQTEYLRSDAIRMGFSQQAR